MPVPIMPVPLTIRRLERIYVHWMSRHVAQVQGGCFERVREVHLLPQCTLNLSQQQAKATWTQGKDQPVTAAAGQTTPYEDMAPSSTVGWGGGVGDVYNGCYRYLGFFKALQPTRYASRHIFLTQHVRTMLHSFKEPSSFTRPSGCPVILNL